MSEATLRLSRIRIEGFGRLRGVDFRPGSDAGTVVIAPNESGKSTLASAIVRGLFGFDAKADEDRRRPWSGGPFRVQQEWVLGERERCRIERDFETQEVVVEWSELVGGEPVVESRWSGQPNPRGRSADRRRFDAELTRLLGFSSPEVFVQTSYIGPGRFAARPVELELLKLLSGGERADFQSALREIEESYYELTRADLSDPSRASKHKPRRIETLLENREQILRTHESASTQREARAAAERALGKAQARLAELEAAVESREAQQAAMSRLLILRREEASITKRLDELDAAMSRIAEWEEGVRTRTQALEPLVKYVRLPSDYLLRLQSVEERRGEVRRLELELGQATKNSARASRLAAILGVTSVAVFAGAVGSAALEAPIGVSLSLGVAGVLLVSAFLWSMRHRNHTRRANAEKRSALKERLTEIEHDRAELAEWSEGDSDELDVATETERYERAHRLRAELDGMKEARASLGNLEALGAERRELAEVQLGAIELERRQILDTHTELEDDAEAERRFAAETRRLKEEFASVIGEELTLRRKVADLPTGAEEVADLDGQLEMFDSELARLKIERDAYRLAHCALLECRDAFVSVVLKRVDERVGSLLDRMTDGRYRRIFTDPQTFEVTVDGAGRTGVTLAALSRATRDQVSFALRLAVVEILARDRVMPLVLDDPFLHFDDRRLSLAQQVLSEMTRAHQVILLTHDTRVSSWGWPRVDLPPVPAGVVSKD